MGWRERERVGERELKTDLDMKDQPVEQNCALFLIHFRLHLKT